MTKIYFFIAIVLICFNFSCSDSQNNSVKEKNTETENISGLVDTLKFIGETAADLSTPESVKFDSVNQILYASNINGKPSEKDGNGFISKISLNNKVLDRKWVTGLDAPKGTGIYEGKLYVSDIDRLVEISIKTGKILTVYPTDDAEFLNDIDIDDAGNVYVSDMTSDRIFRLKDKIFSVWLQSDELVKPNGLFVKKGMLYVGVKNKILAIDIKTKEITTLFDNTGGIDGLEGIGNNQFVFSDWSGHIYITEPDGTVKLLLNTAKDDIQAADIEYCAEKDAIFVPTFYHNTISTYKFIRN